MREYYEALLHDCASVLQQTYASDDDGMMAAAHAFIADLQAWQEVLDGRLEHGALSIAAREYQHALMAVVLGQYRQAFGSLRTYLELTCAALFFSANELHLRLWLRGEEDVSWSRLIDEDVGVFSHTFARAFFPELKDDVVHYRELAKKVYRECSEFVHANPHTHGVIPGQVTFDRSLFVDWHEKAGTTRMITTFALVLRYASTFSKDALTVLEATILDQLSHIEAVRHLFNQESN